MIKEAPGNNWYEDEFPPQGDMTKGRYSGYNTWNECMLFHEFAVNLYDMWFSYKGKKYFFNNEGKDGVLWSAKTGRRRMGNGLILSSLSRILNWTDENCTRLSMSLATLIGFEFWRGYTRRHKPERCGVGGKAFKKESL